MTSTPNLYPHLTPYERPDSYAGTHFYDYLTVYAVHRDSQVIERSNWRVLLRACGFTAERKPTGEIKTNAPNYDEHADQPEPIIVTRAHHWAVGWIDTLRILPTADPTLLAQLDAMIGRLEDYPILDESDESALEWDEAIAYWQSMSVSERVQYLQAVGQCIFAARRSEFPEDSDGSLLERMRD